MCSIDCAEEWAVSLKREQLGERVKIDIEIMYFTALLCLSDPDTVHGNRIKKRFSCIVNTKRAEILGAESLERIN